MKVKIQKFNQDLKKMKKIKMKIIICKWKKTNIKPSIIIIKDNKKFFKCY